MARRQIEPRRDDGGIFVGIGIASIATSFARTPFEIGVGLFAIGAFAAIYHPVGLAIVVERWKNTAIPPSTVFGATSGW